MWWICFYGFIVFTQSGSGYLVSPAKRKAKQRHRNPLGIDLGSFLRASVEMSWSQEWKSWVLLKTSLEGLNKRLASRIAPLGRTSAAEPAASTSLLAGAAVVAEELSSANRGGFRTSDRVDWPKEKSPHLSLFVATEIVQTKF